MRKEEAQKLAIQTRLIYSFEDGFRLRMALGQGLRLRLEA